MKTLFIILMMTLLVSTAWARPQMFYYPVNPGTPEAQRESRYADGTLRPIPTGAIYMMSRYGFEVINPGAKAKLGIGQTVLTQPVAAERRIADGTNDTPFGGIRLIGLAF